MRERLEMLRGEEKEFKQALKVNIEEQHRLMIMIYGEDTGVYEDGLVYYKGKLAKVTGFDCTYKVTPRVTYYNKDMQLSKREISAWDANKLKVFSE